MDLSVLQEEVAPRPKAGEPEVAQRNFDFEVDGRRFSVRIRERLQTTTRPKKPKPPKAAAIGGGGGERLRAPMQGTIVKVLVKKGDRVQAGQAVCVLEAMKMENSILAHTDGTVAELDVPAGQSVETGATIAVIR